MAEPSKQVWLLTSLGMGDARPTRYKHEGKEQTFDYAPQAVMSLGLPKVTNVLLIYSRDVPKKSRSDVAATALKLGCQITEVEIPLGLDVAEQAEIFELVAAKLPVGCSVVLDITQGLRPLPFFFHALALYLESMKGVLVVGAWYCPVELKDVPEPKPLVDLSSILKLGAWTAGVRDFKNKMDFCGLTSLIPDVAVNADVFQDSQIISLQQELEITKQKLAEHGGKIGEADPERRPELIREKHQIQEQLQDLESDLAQRRLELCGPSERRAAVRKQILDASVLHLAGLTLDAACRLASSPLTQSDILGLIPEDIPLRTELAGQVHEGIKHLVGNLSSGAKSKHPLTADWLRCQWDVIDKFRVMGLHGLQIAAVREWALSYVLLRHWPKSANSGWLDYRNRKPAENCLNDLRRRKSNSENDKHWQLFWERIANTRNEIQHMGMTEREVVPFDFVMDADSLDFWNSLRDGNVDAPSLPGGELGKLLVVPIGMSPGVLFTALKKENPDVLLLIGSNESLSSAKESIEKAGWKGKQEMYCVQDPHTGVAERESLCATQTIRELVSSATKVVGVLTGGTTLLGIMVQDVLSLAPRLLPVRRIFLVDRRSIHAQKSDPYQEGECHIIRPLRY